jgi:hypothetical protein
LRKRAFRHALDPRTPFIIDAQCQIIHYGNKTGLLIHHPLHASFKDVEYDVKVAFTVDGLVATGCDCKAGGGSTNDQHVCVHIAPNLLQLTLLLHDGLAEHCLVELAVLWTQERDAALREESTEAYKKMMDSLYVLSCCANPTKDFNLALQNDTAFSLLSRFSVGTENSKLAPVPPKVEDLGPFRNFDLVNPTAEFTRNAHAIKVLHSTSLQADADATPPEARVDTTLPGTDADIGEQPSRTVSSPKINALVAAILKQFPGSNGAFREYLLGFKLQNKRSIGESLTISMVRSMERQLKKQLQVASKNTTSSKNKSPTLPKLGTSATTSSGSTKRENERSANTTTNYDVCAVPGCSCKRGIGFKRMPPCPKNPPDPESRKRVLQSYA